MNKLIITAAAFALTIGAASAQSINPGVAQLAASAGVSPEGYTQAQLVQLLDAQKDNDQERIAFIMSQAGDDSVTRSNMGNTAVSSDTQLAASAGVAPGLYTTNELQRLIEAKRMNDLEEVTFILSGQNRVMESSNGVSAGKAQLAASLGVDASQYTLAELTKLQAERFARNM